MYRSLSILFVSLIGFCAFAQNMDSDANANKQALSSSERISGTQDELLNKAARLYSTSKFAESAAVYEQVAARYGTSDNLFYNLGNAYYKSKDIPSAILNYERALKLNPGDRDTRFNLEMCQARIVDKIEPIGMFMLTRWYNSLENCFSSNAWATISLVSFLLLIAGLFLYFFTRISILKKISFFGGIALLAISVLSLVYAADQYDEMIHPDQAILFSATVTIKSSPDQSGTDIFVVHEGSKVTVLSKLGAWSEIELIDGNIGWLETKHIKTI